MQRSIAVLEGLTDPHAVFAGVRSWVNRKAKQDLTRCVIYEIVCPKPVTRVAEELGTSGWLLVMTTGEIAPKQLALGELT